MINQIRRGMAVIRYHTEPRVRLETVGHHTANLCAILLALDPNVSRNVLIRALVHDVAEAHTGDIPAPAKRDSPGLSSLLMGIEVKYLTEHKIPWPPLSDEEKILLKLADITDLVISSTEEVKLGNSYARQVASKGVGYIMALGAPAPLVQRALSLITEATNYESE